MLPRVPRLPKISPPLVLVTALVALVALVAACSGAGDKEKASSKQPAKDETTTTTAPPPPNAPLTGLPDASGESLKRCALAVKIENDPDARPQRGIIEADVVYDTVIDGGVTRLFAVFNSTVPESVGPVRSVRPIDIDLAPPFGGVFAYSGGVPENVSAIRSVPGLVTVDENNRDALYRISERRPPRNLYGNPAVLFSMCPEASAPPRPVFTFRAAGMPAPVGQAVESFTIFVSTARGYEVTYTWRETEFGGVWARSMSDGPTVDPTGAQVAPQNAIVMFTQWQGSVGGFNSKAITVGEGDAVVYTDGHAVAARWSRASAAEPIVYRDLAGGEILFTPGRTWIEIAPAGSRLDVVAAPTTTAAPTTPAAPTTARPKP